MTSTRSTLSAMALVLILAGCSSDRQPLQVGGKQSPENQIVAELVAELADAAGIPVKRRIGLGGSRLTLEALKRGEIDIYPETTGTGLALLGLGQPPDVDPEVSIALLRERYASLGLGWSELLGFENRPGLAMLRDRALSLGIRSYSDLARHADRLALGVDSEFRGRPVDGLAPLGRRYGMEFHRILEIEPRDRTKLYDRLVEGEIDVAVVRSADPQIPLFDLRVLEDDLDFFARHDGALVYREAVLQRFPALEGVLAQLTGAIGDQQMQALSRRVTVRGEDPREVVRAELIRLGLIDGEIGERDRQALNLAVSLSANAEGEAGTILRQLRRSFPTSTVNLVRSSDPLGAIEDASARIALVSAPAFFAPGSVDPATGQPPLRPGIEAVGLVGTSFLQAFALEPGVSRLEDAALIATGPRGSSSYRAAQSVIDGLQLAATLRPVEGDTPGMLADALVASGADVAILMQPVGNSTALELLQRGLPLVQVDNWVQGNNRIVFPYLQPARLAPSDFERFLPAVQGSGARMPGFSEPVETLATQLVLAGPAPPDDLRLATQGPGASFIPRALPLTDQAVERINAATGRTEDIYPVLPQARALAPRLPQPPEPLSPSPAASVLSVLALALLVWIAWLTLR
ncbi:glycine betaine ABC transporter substrate-binding protein, partial [Thioalkalivibrio sp.]|uniref:glycine betaine ABC transporter substrate-binding protein n=1 Tax=Thioalkalivibrio sp. TaxID=2093813 RepID=UPI0012D5ACC4